MQFFNAMSLSDVLKKNMIEVRIRLKYGQNSVRNRVKIVSKCQKTEFKEVDFYFHKAQSIMQKIFKKPSH